MQKTVRMFYRILTLIAILGAGVGVIISQAVGNGDKVINFVDNEGPIHWGTK